MKIKKILLFGCLLFGCNACVNQMVVTDEAIPKNIRQTIHSLNDEFISGCEKQDTNRLLEIYNKRFPALGDSLGSFMNHYGGTEIYGKADVLTDFYYKGNDDVPIKVEVKTSPSKGYTFKIKPKYKEEVTSLVGLESGRLLVFVYGKRGERWKLDNVELGTWRVLGKDFYEWSEAVKSSYADKKLLSAYVGCCLVSKIIDWTGRQVYTGQSGIKKQCDGVVKEFKEVFGEKLKEISAAPLILDVIAILRDGRYCPRVSYQTRVALPDTAAIRRECDLLDVSLRELHQPTDLIGDTIYYQVYASDQREKADFVFAKSRGK